jgi:U3 small nucleolar ribonucleoprotein protein IMP4
MDELVNKLVICCKKPKKKAKILCKQFRKMFLPNVAYKLKDENISVKRYKLVADDYKMSRFIVTGDSYIKIGRRTEGPTITFSIEEYDEKMKVLNNTFYETDPLITCSGESDLVDFFKDLSHPGNVPTRNIHIHFEDDRIELRHYKIETVEEEEIKVGLTELGPRITLKIKKIEDSFFNIN